MATDEELAFPRLTAQDIEGLRPFGHERAVNVGDVLFAEGDRNFCFFVVLEGEMEIVEHSSGKERRVATHPAGHFSGDIDMLTGRSALVTARMAKPGRVLQVSTNSLREAVKHLPDLGERVLKAFLTRRALLLSTGFQGIRIIGSRFSPEAHTLSDFATRNQVPFTWIDLERDRQAEALLRQFGVGPSATPVVLTADGRMLSRPSVADLAREIGLEAPLTPDELYDLVIVGAGPAGLGAAVYAASEGLNTIMLDATAAGGQAGTSSRIENYLGFPAGISGAELTGNALLQAQRFGAHISVPKRVAGLRLQGGHRVIVVESGEELHARCVLVASGVEYGRLPIEGYAKFEGAGIYYAATEMEAQLCKDDDVVVVGGGNSAGQAIVFLSRHTKNVHVLLRSDDLGKSMSRYLVDRVACIENVHIHKTCEVTSLEGDNHLEAVVVKREDGVTERFETSGLFMFIGATPHTKWLRGCVELDAKGFVLTGDGISREAIDDEIWRRARRGPAILETSLPGVFAAGDVRSGSVKRVASAVGEGAMAVTLVHAHIGAPA